MIMKSPVDPIISKDNPLQRPTESYTEIQSHIGLSYALIYKYANDAEMRTYHVEKQQLEEAYFEQCLSFVFNKLSFFYN